MVALLALGAAVGCGGGERQALAPRSEPGKTRVRIDNHLGWPYRIESVRVRVDGRPVASLRGELPATKWLEPLPLSPGWHALVLRVVAAYASDMVGGRCAVQLRKRVIFALGPQPVTVAANLHLRGVTYDFSERPTVAVRLHGAREVSPELLRQLRHAEERCGSGTGTETLLCRAEQRTANAARHQDEFGLQCFEPKLDAMRKLADVRHRWLERMKEDPGAAAPAGSPEAMVLLAERRIETVWRELEQCAPDTATPGSDFTRSVEGKGCDSRAPPDRPSER